MTVRIEVELGKRSYPVVIDIGESFSIEKLIVKQHPERIFAIFDAQLFTLHGKSILRSLRKTGLPLKTLAIPVSEKLKNARTLGELYRWLLTEGISRSDIIIACGGGVTTDIVGYTAATIMRGIAWGAVPTTLIGMVDAAIGGKTGINHSLAKNAIGAVWQPQFVYAHVPLLHTLSPRQLHAGAGELVKYAGLIGEPFLAQVKLLVDHDLEANLKKWENLISTASGYKASLVSTDERDTGVRQFLNLGHTFAHGIERSLGYGRLLHGEAVAIGLLTACNLSRKVITGADRQLISYRELVEANISGIPEFTLDVDDIMISMQLDKKRSGKTVKFVLLKRPGKAIVMSGIDVKLVRQSLSDAIHYYSVRGGKSGTNTHH